MQFKNKSKSVSREEYLCLTSNGFSARNKNRDEYLSADELTKGSEWSKAADKNNDGRISVVEFMTGAERAFISADKNGDGTLSEGEFKELVY